MLRRPVISLLSLVLFFFSADPIPAQEVLPVAVFVRALETPPLPPLKAEAHQAEIERTSNEMRKVSAQLRKDHGKPSAWPPEAWKVFYDASDANTLAVARRNYEPDTRSGLADSVEDFLRGASAAKAMTMVTSAEEASLIVQIVGRRRASPPGMFDGHYFIRFRVLPGPKLTGARFLELTRDYGWDMLGSTLIAHAKDPSGYVDLEAASPASFKNCAATVRFILATFIVERLDPAKKKQ